MRQPTQSNGTFSYVTLIIIMLSSLLNGRDYIIAATGMVALFRAPQGIQGGVFPSCLDLSGPSWIICGWETNQGSWVAVYRCLGEFVTLVFITESVSVIEWLRVF